MSILVAKSTTKPASQGMSLTKMQQTQRNWSNRWNVAGPSKVSNSQTSQRTRQFPLTIGQRSVTQVMPNFWNKGKAAPFSTIADTHCLKCGKKVEKFVHQQGDSTYKEVQKFLSGCPSATSDHFDVDQECEASKELETSFRGRIKNHSGVMFYSPNSAALFMSAFLKQEGKSEQSSDLTGDQGKLAKEMVGKHYQLKEFSSVVDVGGQDASFVESFNDATQIVVDMNVATPFLHPSSKVQYAIGAAQEVFSNPKFLPEEGRGKTLFAMSNFLNVLNPKEALETFQTIVGRMQKGDSLVITNLAIEQFNQRPNYKIGEAAEGLSQVYKIDGQPYKTVIDSSFASKIAKSGGLTVVEEKLTQLTIELPGKKDKKPKVYFRTILFQK